MLTSSSVRLNATTTQAAVRPALLRVVVELPRRGVLRRSQGTPGAQHASSPRRQGHCRAEGDQRSRTRDQVGGDPIGAPRAGDGDSVLWEVDPGLSIHSAPKVTSHYSP